MNRARVSRLLLWCVDIECRQAEDLYQAIIKAAAPSFGGMVQVSNTDTIHPGDSLYFYLQWWRVDILSIVWPGVGSRLGADLEPGHHSGVASIWI